jgi:itaconyl-CoA hydratase
VLERRESKSRPDVDVLVIKTIGYNQRGEIVISFKRTVLVYRRGCGPAGRHRPQPKISPGVG